MKKSILYFLLASMVFMSGCASLVSKSQYPIHINSNPEGAEIKIYKKNGKLIFSGKTPTIVTLKAEDGFFRGADYRVHYKKAGYQDAVGEIRSSVDGWYFTNFLFSSVVGLLIVDPLTGAMWKLDDEISIELNKNQAANDKRELQILSLNEVPEHLRVKMVRIN